MIDDLNELIEEANNLPDDDPDKWELLEEYTEDIKRVEASRSWRKQYVIAHEIGHLLYAEHSTTGIMADSEARTERTMFTEEDLKIFQAIEKPR